MATAADGMDPYESVGAGEESYKRRLQSDISTGKSSDEGENSAIIPAAPGISELEQTLNQLTFTRLKIQRPTTLEDLPDEILTNIFIRLLAKQLAQMWSVSKSWNGLLSHPFFVKSHLHHSIRKNNQQILLVFPYYHLPFTQFSCGSLYLEPTNFIKHIPTNLPMSWVIVAVNGLICLSEPSLSNIHIWNPSLSAVSTIPPPHSITYNSPNVRHMRFGFDPKTDDYKLVNISGIRSNNDYFSVKEWLPIEVYSIRKGCWEFITQPVPSHIRWIYYTNYPCVVDGHAGHLHWYSTSTTNKWDERKIMVFDLGLETFCEMPSILNSNYKMQKLGVLDGKLCEMAWHKDGEWEVWVMEEYGLPESWVKRHVFPQFNHPWIHLYGFTLRNELVFNDNLDRLLLYDPIENKTKSTRTEELSVYKIVEYMDSLVWI